jgi:hypothetical protein
VSVDDLAQPAPALRAPAARWPLTRERAVVAAIGAVLFVGSTVVYLLIGPHQEGTDAFFPLADALLHGRAHLIGGPYTWIEVVPRPGGDGWYIPYPPIPAVVLLPIAAFSGQSGDTAILAALLGGLSTVLMFACLGRIGLPLVARTVLAVAFAFGTELMWAAGVGGTHLYAQVLGMTFLLGALLVALHGRWPLLAGLLLGLGAGSRLPIGLALPVLLYLYRDLRFGWTKVLLGVAPVALAVAVYNDLRFGSPFEFGYAMITSLDGQSVLSENWYPDGIVSFGYLPRGLYSMFLRTFEFRDQAPWLVPTWAGQSVLVTTPALLWLVRSAWREPFVQVLAGTSLLVLLPDLFHGNPGYAQFGYRFILDALPLLWLLLGLVVVRTGLTRWLTVALAVGCAVFAYGFWAIDTLQIVTP